MTHGLPADALERLAREQRHVLENRVVELRRTVKQRLDIRQNLRDHIWIAAGAFLVVGAVLGYTVTGIFTRD